MQHINSEAATVDLTQQPTPMHDESSSQSNYMPHIASNTQPMRENSPTQPFTDKTDASKQQITTNAISYNSRVQAALDRGLDMDRNTVSGMNNDSVSNEKVHSRLSAAIQNQTLTKSSTDSDQTRSGTGIAMRGRSAGLPTGRGGSSGRGRGAVGRRIPNSTTG